MPQNAYYLCVNLIRHMLGFVEEKSWIVANERNVSRKSCNEARLTKNHAIASFVAYHFFKKSSETLHPAMKYRQSSWITSKNKKKSIITKREFYLSYLFEDKVICFNGAPNIDGYFILLVWLVWFLCLMAYQPL